MGVIARWADIAFEVSPENALLLSKLKFSANAETEDKDDGGRKIAGYKSGKGVEINFSVDVLEEFGQDVKAICTKLLDGTQKGESEYFYLGSEKLFPCKMMLAKADVTETSIKPDGKLRWAKIDITMKQSDSTPIIGSAPAASGGGGGGGGSGGSQKASIKITGPKVDFSQTMNNTQTATSTVTIQKQYYANGLNPSPWVSAASAVTTTIASAKTATSAVTAQPAKLIGGGKTR